MSSCSTSTTAAAGSAATTYQDGETAITAIHPDVIRTHILNRLDGPTLASTTCASTQLNSLCTDDEIWKDICNSTWPSTAHPRVLDAISSFPSGHRSFYSDSFPTLHHHGLCHSHNSKKSQQQRLVETTELISAVDIYYAGKLVYSKVLETETLTGWFLSSPLRINLLDLKEIVPAPVMFEGEEGTCMELLEEHLTVSWILIDPAHKRAVNVASSKAVEIRRHWLTEEIQLRYSTVVAAVGGDLVQCGVVVSCGGKEGGEFQLNEVSMQVEDMEGKILTGLDSLVILLEAMEGQRRKSDSKVEKERFETLKKTRKQFSERKQRREKSLDVVYIVTGVSIFFSLWAYFC
ncbi:F-box protein [Forsythia ovata]|uniref:F-box protein n=1 Tax=Forsythia ovata TaxID=205694 RepID=A0ABD1VGN7_9LAMI